VAKSTSIAILIITLGLVLTGCPNPVNSDGDSGSSGDAGGGGESEGGGVTALAAPTITAANSLLVGGIPLHISTNRSDGVYFYYTIDGSTPEFDPTLPDPDDPDLFVTNASTVGIPGGETIPTPRVDSGTHSLTVRAVAWADGQTSPEKSMNLELIAGRVVTAFAWGRFGHQMPNGSLQQIMRDIGTHTGWTVTWAEPRLVEDMADGLQTERESDMKVYTDVIIDGGDHEVWNRGEGNFQQFIVKDGGHLTLRNINLTGSGSFGGRNGRGGLISVETGGTLVLENVTVRNVRMSWDTSYWITGGGQGSDGLDPGAAVGGVLANDGGTVIIRDSVFEDVRTNVGGGILANFSGETTIDNSRFLSGRTDNRRTDGGSQPTVGVWRGGGGLAVYGGEVSITRSYLAGNSAIYNGSDSISANAGAIGVWNDGSLTVQASQFVENSAVAGGAIYADTTGVVRVGSSAFWGNRSDSGGAIARGSAGTDIEVHASTFSWNVWGQTGGIQNFAFAVRSGEVPFWFNSLFVRDGNLWNAEVPTNSNDSSSGLNVDPATVFVRVPDRGDGTWGTSVDIPGNFALLPGASVAGTVIDQGNLSHRMNDLADIDGDGNTSERQPLDINGNPRVQGGSIDRGAAEK
jgi:predicted outer membrane repeat protein